MIQLYNGDCLEVMKGLPASSIDAVITDPPYYKVKGEWWDRQWDTAEGFIHWIGELTAEWYRILKPNGSLYVFASPRMAARVECKITERFNVLNNIIWRKPSSRHNQCDPDILRGYFPQTERIIFAEHYGADNIAKGEAGYEAKCDQLRGFVFEPLRAYLDGERERAGVTVRQVAEAFQRKSGSRTVTGMAGHWFTAVQWALPTAENYQWIKDTLSSLNHGGEYLRREYEDLRREYEDLRRPFSVTAEVPYTDVWDFQTVAAYPGKHPCEKPAALIRHIVTASTRPGAVVLDCFMGSGVTGEVSWREGRDFIGIELDADYYRTAQRRIAEAQAQPSLI